MPWPANHLPKYRKHRASGQAVVTLSGRDHYLGPHGTKASRDFYDRLIAEWLQHQRQPVPEGSDTITVVELCARYLKFAQAYYQKDGRCTKVTPAVKACIKYLRAWYGREPATEFGPLALKSVRQRMVADGLSRRYVNDHVARIKRMFKWAVAEELVPPATYQALTAVSGLKRGRTEAREPAPILPVDDAAVEATLEHLPEVVADMVRLQSVTGMRPAEVCIVRPCDIDRSADVWLYRPASHKTQHRGRERTVFLGKTAQAVLLKYLARAAETYCFRPCDSEQKRLAVAHANRKTPLTAGNRPGTNRSANPARKPGERYAVDAYRRAITRACEVAEIEHWAPNRLRHSYATRVRKECGLEAAQVALGHSSADVTQIYAERDLNYGIEVARRIG
ncbi:tyrosine-type recombinase/integrase [Lacipirellula parvula]|uniref:Tyr recombinase domain-containing protein n=1 Tax=Lacipirellula parvula TaxID=2650471 RepID=A0A5K7XLL9_9BACT|nr:site-specific integrase [Lacipirellula parvula]BBO35556.1 hypothetical protein PLANPX_5168 [Lacipirellula parvula]